MAKGQVYIVYKMIGWERKTRIDIVWAVYAEREDAIRFTDACNQTAEPGDAERGVRYRYEWWKIS